MNTQQQTRPAITPAMREQAAKQPNTWLYVVDPIFTDPAAEVPPWGFIGGYRVDERGELTDDFSPNPNYRPSPVALRLPAPTNDAERALQLTTTGYAQGQMLLTTLLDAELILFAQPQGSGLFTVEHESGRRQLQAFTSETYLPPNWSTWQRMTGRQIAQHHVTGTDIQLNPTSPVKARIAGEDLVKAFNTTPLNGSGPSTPAPGLGAPVTNGTNGAAVQPVAPTEDEPAAKAAETPAKPEQPEAVAEEAPASAHTKDPLQTTYGQRLLGSLLTSAAGNTLGTAVESLTAQEIRDQHGSRGITEYSRDRRGEFSDDTQVTLFTLEGLIRGHAAVRAWPTESPLPSVQLALQRWLHTQGVGWKEAAGPFATQYPEPDGRLINRRELFSDRSPNPSLVAAVRAFAEGANPGTPAHAIIEGRSSDGVVRATPVAMWSSDSTEVFELAVAVAALTCSHPADHLPAGVAAVIVQGALRGDKLADAVAHARSVLTGYAGHDDTDAALQAAIDLAANGTPDAEALNATLGTGANGTEALAIAVCAVLSADGLAPAVLTAVNHSGASDVTGALCGAIAGAAHGLSALPGVWLRDLQQREIVEDLTRDALLEFSPQPPADAGWVQRYPAARDTTGLPFRASIPTTTAANEPSAATTPAPESTEDTTAGADPTVDAPAENADETTEDSMDSGSNPDTGHDGSGDPATGSAGVANGAAVAGAVTATAAAAAASTSDSVAKSGDAAAEPDPDRPISDEEVRLFTAWRKFRDSDENSPEVSDGLRKLLEEAFGASRAEQLLAELEAEPAPELSARLAGCVIGTAVGDALGAPWMYQPLRQILKANPDGVREHAELFGTHGAATAITQQALSVVDATIRASIRGVHSGTPAHLPTHVARSLGIWLGTQGVPFDGDALPVKGELAAVLAKQGQRGPDESTTQALVEFGVRTPRTTGHPPNASRSFIAAARGAVVGFHDSDLSAAVTLGADTAAVTHGHPDGYLPAGALAGLVSQLVAGCTLPEAVDAVIAELESRNGAENTVAGLRAATKLAAQESVSSTDLESLGSGWHGSQTLAIAVTAALSHPEDLESAVALAATHSGNTAATAALCAALRGTAQGVDALPSRWLDGLELREIAEQLVAARLRIAEEIAPGQELPGWATQFAAD